MLYSFIKLCRSCRANMRQKHSKSLYFKLRQKPSNSFYFKLRQQIKMNQCNNESSICCYATNSD